MYLCYDSNQILIASCQTLRYLKPPDALVTQLDIYTEEKFEDEEDLRERTLASHRRREASESEAVFDEVIKVAKQQGELYHSVVSIVSSLHQLLEEDLPRSVTFLI